MALGEYKSPLYKQRDDNERKLQKMINTHTADGRDGVGHLTRGTRLNFGIADCLYSHSLKM